MYNHEFGVIGRDSDTRRAEERDMPSFQQLVAVGGGEITQGIQEISVIAGLGVGQYHCKMDDAEWRSHP